MLARVSPVILLILILAIIGFVIEFMQDPINMMIILGLTAVVLFLVKNFMKSGKFLPQFSKAAPPKPVRTPVKKSKRHVPFQVIEGSKGKNKEKEKDKEKEPRIFH
ncbi:hypothetical protein [Brevibacillus sp. SYSU BS000544]|uniref:hypothetical protein n=1 Tax=Brevibacillus sp. SYSU BS000544 TaxID=3416443 RepID=UPI003CE585ED